MTARWLCASKCYTLPISEKRSHFFLGSDESSWDMRQSRKPAMLFYFFFLSLLLFFLLCLCSGVDNIRTWPLWDKVYEPHGNVGNILNAALKRNTSKECQTLSISDKRFLFPFFSTESLCSGVSGKSDLMQDESSVQWRVSGLTAIFLSFI